MDKVQPKRQRLSEQSSIVKEQPLVVKKESRKTRREKLDYLPDLAGDREVKEEELRRKRKKESGMDIEDRYIAQEVKDERPVQKKEEIVRKKDENKKKALGKTKRNASESQDAGMDPEEAAKRQQKKEEQQRKAQQAQYSYTPIDYPMSKRQVPLKMTKYESQANKNNIHILTEADGEAVKLINQMRHAYLTDARAFHSDQMAYHKVKLLNKIKVKLEYVFTRRKFIEHGGLEQFFKWLLPIYDKNKNQMEPSLAVKMGVLRIVNDMKLAPDEIKEYAANLSEMMNRNLAKTKITELKDLCNSILRIWDYTVYKNLNVVTHRA